MTSVILINRGTGDEFWLLIALLSPGRCGGEQLAAQRQGRALVRAYGLAAREVQGANHRRAHIEAVDVTQGDQVGEGAVVIRFTKPEKTKAA